MTESGVHDLVVFLLAAGLVVPVARRLRINPVLAFLMVGMVVGPFGITRFAERFDWLGGAGISNVALTDTLAELGVIFLLFMIALELPLARLLGMRRQVFGLGMAQVLLTGAVIGGIAFAFGNSIGASVVIGGALALSSTAIVSQHLLESRLIGSSVGKPALGVLLAQDLAVVPLLFLVGALATDQAGSLGGSLLVALGQALFAIVAIVLLGRWLVRPLFRLVAEGHSSEIFMATTLLVITVTATATHAAGLSAALGAFLAGLLLAETEYRHEIELIIEPLKGLLLGLFFISVGMHIDLAEVANNPLWILLSVVGLMVTKALLGAALVRLFGASTAVSAEVGLMLGQGGEFAFVIVGAAVATALIPAGTGQFMLIVVSATMVLTPLAIRIASWFGRNLQDGVEIHEPGGNEDAGFREHVILVGFGRTGELLAEILTERNYPWVALDLDAVRVGAAQAEGLPLYLGDASRLAMLQKVNLAEAAAVVVSTDDHRFSERILSTVRHGRADVPVLMRVHGSEQGSQFVTQGATVTVPEVLESGLQLASSLFDILGVARDDYEPMVDARRNEHGLRLNTDSVS